MAKLADLPLELLIEIFEHFDYVTLKIILRRVCRDFHSIITNNYRPLLGNVFSIEPTPYKPQTNIERIREKLHEREFPPNIMNRDHDRLWSSRYGGIFYWPKSYNKFFHELGYCFRLHPCLRNLRANYKALETRKLDIKKDFGFVNASAGAGSWKPLIVTDFAKERAASDPIPAAEFFKRGAAEELPFIASFWDEVPDLTELTVLQLVQFVADTFNDNHRVSKTDANRRVNPLSYENGRHPLFLKWWLTYFWESLIYFNEEYAALQLNRKISERAGYAYLTLVSHVSPRDELWETKAESYWKAEYLNKGLDDRNVKYYRTLRRLFERKEYGKLIEETDAENTQSLSSF